MLAVEYWSADCFYTQFVSFYFQNKHTMYLTPRKLNFRIEVTIYLHKNLRKARLERKQTNKQANKTSKNKAKMIPISPNDFLLAVYLLLSQKSVKQTRTIYGME